MRAADWAHAFVSSLALVIEGSIGGGALAAMAGCDAVLGIDPATLAPLDGGTGAGGGDASSSGNASSGSTASSTGTAPSSDAGGMPDPPTCENYCKVIAQSCQGEYAEYLATPDGGTTCLDICGILFPMQTASPYYPYPGSDPDVEDSLACRLWHAHAAADPLLGPAVHCRHAGPLGSTACGDPVAAFCKLDWRYCFDNSSVNVYDGGQRACASTLGAALANDGGFYAAVDSGDLVDERGPIENGNTLNCRLWHLETAISQGAPETHCPHTGFPSVDMRGGPGPCE